MVPRQMLREAPCDHQMHLQKKKNKVAQGSLALLLPETLSNPFSEEGQALGKGLETIHRTGLRQDLVMGDLFISLRSRLTMSRMSQNRRNLSKRSTGEGREGDEVRRPAIRGSYQR